jgi:hypothetical protein
MPAFSDFHAECTFTHARTDLLSRGSIRPPSSLLNSFSLNTRMYLHTHIHTVTHIHTQVFYRGFHMHHIGERMVTRQFRPTTGGGAPALVRLDSVEFWDFSMQVRMSNDERGA